MGSRTEMAGSVRRQRHRAGGRHANVATHSVVLEAQFQVRLPVEKKKIGLRRGGRYEQGATVVPRWMWVESGSILSTARGERVTELKRIVTLLLLTFILPVRSGPENGAFSL